MDGFPDLRPSPAPTSSPTSRGNAARGADTPAYSLLGDIRQHRRWYGLLLVAFLIWGGTDVRFRGILQHDRPDRHKTDFTAYTEASKAFFDGRDPYEVTNIRGWGYMYPPLFALLVWPVAECDSQTQVVLFYLFSILTLLGCVHELRKLAEGLSQGRTAAGVQRLDWMALALAALLPAFNTLQRGQVGILKLYPLLVGVRWILLGDGRARTMLMGGVALALPIVLKVTPALPVATFLIGLGARCVLKDRPSPRIALREVPWPGTTTDSRRRLIWATTGVALGSLAWWIVIPSLCLGWEANANYLRQWHDKVIAKAGDVRAEDFGGDVTSPRNQSLANSAYRMGNWIAYRLKLGPDDRLVDSDATRTGRMPMDAPQAEAAVFGARLICGSALVATVCLLGWSGRRDDLLLALGLGCVGTLVLSPVSRGHYFVLMAPAVLFLPTWLEARGWSNRGGAWGWGPGGLVVAHYLGLKFTGRIGLLGLGTTMWLMGTLGMVVIGLARSRRLSLGQPDATSPSLAPAKSPPRRQAA